MRAAGDDRPTLPEDPAAPRLRVGVDAYFKFLSSRPPVWRLLFRDPPADPELLEVQRRLQEKRSELLTSLLSQEGSATRKGKRLFGADAKPGEWELLDTRTSTTGVLLSRYRPKGAVRTGSFADAGER